MAKKRLFTRTNKIKGHLAFVVALVLLGACYFPHDSYVNPAIHPPGTIEAGLDIASLNDPHALVYPTTFTFNVITGGKQVMFVEVFRDGDSWIHSGYEKVEFTLDPADFSDGEHEILINVKLTSGSGSIAELLQGEYYEFEKAFTFTVNKSTPQPVSGLTTAMEDGKLVLRWNKPGHEHFEYVIHRSYWYADDSGSQNFIRIKDPSTTEFVDESFTGGSVTYTVTLESPSFSVASTLENFVLEPVASSATMDDNNVVKLSWPDPYDFGDSVYVAVTTGDETVRFAAHAGETVIDTLILGDRRMVSFKIVREGYEPEGYQKDFTFEPGFRIKPFDEIRLLPSNKLILAKRFSYDPNRTHIYRYDATSMTLEDSLILDKRSSSLLFSPDAAHAYVVHYANFAQSELWLIKFNPLDFSEPTSAIDLSRISYDGNYLVAPRNLSLANNNVLVFEDARYSRPRVVQIDLNSKSPTWSREYVDTPVLSHDGSLMVVRDGSSGQVWKKNGSSWELHANVPAGDFYFTVETMLIVSSATYTTVYNPNDISGGSLLQPVFTSSLPITGYDAISNSLISEVITDYHVSVIKILNRDLTEKFEVRANVYHEYPDYTHIYTGSGHYITSGFMEKIDL